MFTANRDTFFEDVAVIEAQQEMLDKAPEPARPVRWHIDKGVDRAQRWVAKTAERGGGAKRQGRRNGLIR